MRLVSPVLYRLGGVRAARFFLRPVRRVYAVTRWGLPYCLIGVLFVVGFGWGRGWREMAVGAFPAVLGAFVLLAIGLIFPQVFRRRVGSHLGWWLWPLLYVVCVWVSTIVVLGSQPELILLTLDARLDNLWRSWVVLGGVAVGAMMFTRRMVR